MKIILYECVSFRSYFDCCEKLITFLFIVYLTLSSHYVTSSDCTFSDKTHQYLELKYKETRVISCIACCILQLYPVRCICIQRLEYKKQSSFS